MPFDKSGKRREATLNEKIKVIEGRAQGEIFSKIGEKLHLLRSQASKIHKRWKTKESVNNQQRTGRPETLSDRDKRHLTRLVEANPEAILADIMADSRLNVSERTVSNYLRSENYYIHIARTKPWLKEEQKVKRRRWCSARLNWPMQVCHTRIFTDECTVEIVG
jgi:hypothetical protein